MSGSPTSAENGTSIPAQPTLLRIEEEAVQQAAREALSNFGG